MTRLHDLDVRRFGDVGRGRAGRRKHSIVGCARLREGRQGPVCIVNYAEKGWSNTQEMVGLIEHLKHAARKPDIVLFYDGGTEAFAAYQSGQPTCTATTTSSRISGQLGRRAESGLFLLPRDQHLSSPREIGVKAPLHRKEKGPRKAGYGDAFHRGVENYEQNMSLIVNLAGEAIWIPSRLRVVSQSGGRTQATDALRATSAERGI
jgi:hypothetical protein